MCRNLVSFGWNDSIGREMTAVDHVNIPVEMKIPSSVVFIFFFFPLGHFLKLSACPLFSFSPAPDKWYPGESWSQSFRGGWAADHINIASAQFSKRSSRLLSWITSPVMQKAPHQIKSGVVVLQANTSAKKHQGLCTAGLPQPAQLSTLVQGGAVLDGAWSLWLTTVLRNYCRQQRLWCSTHIFLMSL